MTVPHIPLRREHGSADDDVAPVATTRHRLLQPLPCAQSDPRFWAPPHVPGGSSSIHRSAMHASGHIRGLGLIQYTAIKKYGQFASRHCTRSIVLEPLDWPTQPVEVKEYSGTGPRLLPVRQGARRRSRDRSSRYHPTDRLHQRTRFQAVAP